MSDVSDYRTFLRLEQGLALYLRAFFKRKGRDGLSKKYVRRIDVALGVMECFPSPIGSKVFFVPLVLNEAGYLVGVLSYRTVEAMLFTLSQKKQDGSRVATDELEEPYLSQVTESGLIPFLENVLRMTTDLGF